MWLQVDYFLIHWPVSGSPAEGAGEEHVFLRRATPTTDVPMVSSWAMPLTAVGTLCSLQTAEHGLTSLLEEQVRNSSALSLL